MDAPNWMKLLEKHEELRKSGRGSIYDRVVILSQVYADREYREALGDEWVKNLDRQVDDCFTNFTVLNAMLAVYPERRSWVEGDLVLMRREALKRDTNKKAREERFDELVGGDREVTPDDETKSKDDKGRSLSWKRKFLELEEKYKVLEASYKQLERDHNKLRKVVEKRLSGEQN